MKCLDCDDREARICRACAKPEKTPTELVREWARREKLYGNMTRDQEELFAKLVDDLR